MAGFRSDFKRATRVLYRNRHYSFLMLSLLVAFSLVGFLWPEYFLTEQQMFREQIMELTAGRSLFDLFVIILLNNLRAAFLSIMLGIFFGLIPLFVAAVNGYFLGAVMSNAWKAGGANTLLLVVPHGVFELPGLAIAFGLGLRFGLWFREKAKWQDIKVNFSDFMLVYFYIVAPLLLIAAVIESALIAFF